MQLTAYGYVVDIHQMLHPRVNNRLIFGIVPKAHVASSVQRILDCNELLNHKFSILENFWSNSNVTIHMQSKLTVMLCIQIKVKTVK